MPPPGTLTRENEGDTSIVAGNGEIQVDWVQSLLRPKRVLTTPASVAVPNGKNTPDDYARFNFTNRSNGHPNNYLDQSSATLKSMLGRAHDELKEFEKEGAPSNLQEQASSW